MPIVFVTERSPGRRLYAADCKPLYVGRPKPAGSFMSVLLNGRCWRVTRSNGVVGTIGVSPEALRKACGLQGMSVVLNEQKTPFHRTSLGHDQPFPAVRAVRDAIEGGGYDLSHPALPTYEGFVGEAMDVVAYHGTRHAPFRRFDLSHAGETDDGYYGRGFYLAADKEDAASFGPNVMRARVRLRRPFRLTEDPNMGSDALIASRDAISRLPGMPRSLRPNRQVPKGYRVDSRKENGVTLYYVAPDPSLYGTDRETYGEEKLTRDQAVVAFNDELAGEKGTWDSGWLFGLLRDIGRDRFVSALLKGGYDGVVIVGTDGKAKEYVVFDPRALDVLDWSGLHKA